MSKNLYLHLGMCCFTCTVPTSAQNRYTLDISQSLCSSSLILQTSLGLWPKACQNLSLWTFVTPRWNFLTFAANLRGLTCCLEFSTLIECCQKHSANQAHWSAQCLPLKALPNELRKCYAANIILLLSAPPFQDSLLSSLWGWTDLSNIPLWAILTRELWLSHFNWVMLQT